jgi:hypothetical protein
LDRSVLQIRRIDTLQPIESPYTLHDGASFWEFEVGLFILIGILWKERAIWETRSRWEGLGLCKLDAWDRPSSIMTFDGNPKPVQFIEPNVLDRACLSVGKHDGFADQFGLHCTVLIQNFWRTAHYRWHCWSMFGPTVCAVQSGSTATLVPMLSRWKDWWWLLFQFEEPVDLRSKAPQTFRLLFQDRAQSLPDLLNDCSAVFGVYVDAVVHNKASRVKAPALAPTPPACEHGWQFWTEPETAAFGYLRERLFWEQRALR